MLEEIIKSGKGFFDEPPLAYRFAVTFFIAGVTANPIDMFFQRVGGLSVDISPETIEEGGQNLYSNRLPGRINYGNLVLERGLTKGSLLTTEFNTTMTSYQFIPSNVQVDLLGENRMPLASWLFLKTYPVRWSISDLDANSNQLVIETLELAYTRFQTLTL